MNRTLSIILKSNLSLALASTFHFVFGLVWSASVPQLQLTMPSTSCKTHRFLHPHSFLPKNICFYSFLHWKVTLQKAPVPAFRWLLGLASPSQYFQLNSTSIKFPQILHQSHQQCRTNCFHMDSPQCTKTRQLCTTQSYLFLFSWLCFYTGQKQHLIVFSWYNLTHPQMNKSS